MDFGSRIRRTQYAKEEALGTFQTNTRYGLFEIGFNEFFETHFR